MNFKLMKIRLFLNLKNFLSWKLGNMSVLNVILNTEFKMETLRKDPASDLRERQCRSTSGSVMSALGFMWAESYLRSSATFHCVDNANDAAPQLPLNMPGDVTPACV